MKRTTALLDCCGRTKSSWKSWCTFNYFCNTRTLGQGPGAYVYIFLTYIEGRTRNGGLCNALLCDSSRVGQPCLVHPALIIVVVGQPCLRHLYCTQIRLQVKAAHDVRRQHFHPLTYAFKANALTDSLELIRQNPGTRSKHPPCWENPASCSIHGVLLYLRVFAIYVMFTILLFEYISTYQRSHLYTALKQFHFRIAKTPCILVLL